MELVRDSKGYTLYYYEEEEYKHLPGRHRQATHGNRRTFSESAGKLDFEAKKEMLTKHHEKWVKKLDLKEKEGVVTYTGAAYQTMNKLLRNDWKPKDEYQKAMAEHSEQAKKGLMKGRAPQDFQVKRFVHEDLYKKIVEQNGKHFRDKGFTSTTIKDPTWSGCEIRIKVFKGAPGAYVAPISHYKQEEEFLLPPNATFKVAKHGVDKDGKKWVEVEYKNVSKKKASAKSHLLTNSTTSSIINRIDVLLQETKKAGDDMEDTTRNNRGRSEQAFSKDKFEWQDRDIEFLTDEENHQMEHLTEDHLSELEETEKPATEYELDATPAKKPKK